MTATPSETHEAALSDERLREIIAEAIYNVDPFYESGEYVESFQVSPGGNLTWDQAKARDAEMAGVHFMLPVTKFSYDAADAAINALARRTQPSAGEVVAWQWRQARGHLWRDVEPLPNGMYDLAWYQARPENYVLRPLYATPPDQSRVERLEAALKPFADCVFNDNGDMTISGIAKPKDFVRAYFVIHRPFDAARQALHGDRP